MQISSAKNIRKDLFFPYVGKSLFLHLLLVILIVSTPMILKKLNYQKSNIKMVAVPPSVKVDIVAMPKLTIKELKSLDLSAKTAGGQSEAAFETKAEENAENAFLKKKKKKSFMDLVKSYKNKKLPKAKRKKVNKKATAAGQGSAIDGKKINELLYMGNKVSKGSAVVGSHTDVEMSVYSKYVSSLPDHVKPFWKLPSYLLDKDLRCRVQVFLDKSGKVINLRIAESSGEDEYDQKAIEAIKSSEPFPEVPGEISQLVAKGLLLGFPL